VQIFIKLAWRNILRNKRRSLLAGLAIGVGLASLMWLDALILGMQASMLHSATSSFMGEAQIHAEGFRESFEVENTIVGGPEVAQAVRRDPLVRDAAPRTLSLSMISSPANMATVTLVGVDTDLEPALSDVDVALIAGSYLSPDGKGEVIIGNKLAELLEVEQGDRVVVTAAQAYTGDLSQELFRITGIYHFNIDALDRGMAFVRLPVAQRLLGLGEDFHELAIVFHDMNTASRDDLPFWDRFSQQGNEAVGWKTLLPEMSAAFELVGVQTLILGLILFAIVALGIMNTLFMSMYERMFEFGVLRAVGTPPVAMGRLVMFESSALGLIGVLCGAVLGLLVILICRQTGLDYSGVEFAGATMREALYPIFRARQFILYPAVVLVLTTLIGLYPAAYAARLVPAVAMRRAM